MNIKGRFLIIFYLIHEERQSLERSTNLMIFYLCQKYIIDSFYDVIKNVMNNILRFKLNFPKFRSININVLVVIGIQFYEINKSL